MTPIWTILIASVYERTHQLNRLLSELSQQIHSVPPKHVVVKVLVDRDRCDIPIGVKRTRLVQQAHAASYISFIDDDDHVDSAYVGAISNALSYFPDYVGFRVKYTIDGQPQKPVTHSLACGGWFENDRGYYRDLSHLNPIRREIAQTGLPFLDGFGEDQDWASKVRRDDRLRTEAFVNAELYHYDYRTASSLFSAVRVTEPPHEDTGLLWFPHVQELV